MVTQLMKRHDLCPKGLVPKNRSYMLYNWKVTMLPDLICTFSEGQNRLQHKNLFEPFNKAPTIGL